jgi:hypothetical protein
MKTFDEQLNEHYAAHDAGTLESWDVQYAAAVASGKPWRDVRDFHMGFGSDPETPYKGRVVIYLTHDEIAQAQAATLAEQSAKPAEPTKDELLAQINALMAKVGALP